MAPPSPDATEPPPSLNYGSTAMKARAAAAAAGDETQPWRPRESLEDLSAFDDVEGTPARAAVAARPATPPPRSPVDEIDEIVSSSPEDAAAPAPAPAARRRRAAAFPPRAASPAWQPTRGVRGFSLNSPASRARLPLASSSDDEDDEDEEDDGAGGTQDANNAFDDIADVMRDAPRHAPRAPSPPPPSSIQDGGWLSRPRRMVQATLRPVYRGDPPR